MRKHFKKGKKKLWMVENTQLKAELGEIPAPLCEARKPHDIAYSHKKALQQQWETGKPR